MVARNGQYGSRNPSVAALFVALGLAAASFIGGVAHADETPGNGRKAKSASAHKAEANADGNASKAKDGKVDKAKLDKKALAKNGASDDSGSADKAKTKLKTGGDNGVEEKKEPQLGARVPWRGTGLVWRTTASAAAIGIGPDYQGADYHTVSMHFVATLNYYVLDGDVYTVRITASPSFDVELTNGSTTTLREPQFNDLPIRATLGGINFYRHEKLPISVGAITRAEVRLPTSPASQNNGTIVGTMVGGSGFLTLPMAYEAAHFKSITLLGGVNYTHRFSRATTPVNGDLNRPRQNTLGLPIQSSQLGGTRITAPGLSELIGIFMQEQLIGMTWQLFSGFSFSQGFLDSFNSDTCVATDTGCAPVDAPAGSQAPIGTRTRYGFSTGLSIFPWTEIGINLSYANSTATNGPDGTRQNIFFSPQGATFTAGLSFSPEALYERLTGPKRSAPFVLF